MVRGDGEIVQSSGGCSEEQWLQSREKTALCQRSCPSANSSFRQLLTSPRSTGKGCFVRGAFSQHKHTDHVMGTASHFSACQHRSITQPSAWPYLNTLYVSVSPEPKCKCKIQHKQLADGDVERKECVRGHFVLSEIILRR